MRLTFTVEGKPLGKQRARTDARGRRPRTPDATRQAEARIGWAARNAIPRGWPMDARYRLVVRFFGAHGNTDSSNVLKLVEDACNGVLYLDDRQVDDTRAIRCHGGEPRVEVEVEVLG